MGIRIIAQLSKDESSMFWEWMNWFNFPSVIYLPRTLESTSQKNHRWKRCFSFFLWSPLRSVARLIHKWQFNKNSPLFLPLKFLFTSHYYIVYSSCPLKFLKYPFYTWSFMLLTSQEFESEFPSFGPCFHGILANGDRCICPLLSRNFLPWGFQI